MIQGMDQLAETELHEAVIGLGNWYDVDDDKGQSGKKKHQYLISGTKEDCMTCLKDILIALKQDSAEQGFLAHLKMGEWKVLPNHLVPLFAAYRADAEMSATVLQVMVHLTMHVDVHPIEQLRLLQCLQEYKEAFAKKDVFIILMGKLVESIDEQEEETQQVDNRDVPDVFALVFTLLRNLMSVPDPRPGDAGFTPMRKDLQLKYIRYFHDEGVLDFFVFFAEQLETDKNAEQIWSLIEILYHVVTQVDPEGIMQARKEKEKRLLAELLEKDQDHARISRTQASRHSRFGTTMQRRDALGGVTNSASMYQAGGVSKGNKMVQRDFKNSTGHEKKANMFHDPFFADLEEGSVRDHNQLNPHVKQACDTSHDLSEAVLTGLRKFFEEFLQTSFSTLVSFARGTVLQTRRLHKPVAAGTPMESIRPYGRQHLLNFVSWILEFHRHHFFGEVAKAKLTQAEPPTMDIASIQGAIDLDMIQFVTARLREYGKEASIHSSVLVLVLRCLCQQVKTVSVVMDSKDPDTRNCGEVLTKNLVKEDIMAQLCWIMKHFKSSTHDPRVLSYSVEVFHHMTRLMRQIAERHGSKVEFHVERVTGARLNRAATTVNAEIESLADASVVENLFHLLEKYKKHSPQLNSMLVKLIYSIIRAQPSNIVVFFELSYFVRIQRVWSDPLIRDRKQGKKYHEMVELLRFILRQFFKCAEKNRCVFVELLFRKTFEKKKDAVMENNQSEFTAILDNYEDEEYARLLERMSHGESFDNMRIRQRQQEAGTLPWTAEEDDKLRERYPAFMDHPLMLVMLTAELPEESNRTAKGVKIRLEELGLTGINRTRPADDAAEMSPSKKAKLAEDEAAKERDEDGIDMSMFEAGADIDSLEMDLEKLLDAEESRRTEDTLPNKSAASSCSSGLQTAGTADVAETAVDPDADTQPELGLDLELELEALINESGSVPFLEATQVDPSATNAAATIEDDLAAMLEESGIGTQPAVDAAAEATTQATAEGDEAQFWDDAVLAEEADVPQQPQGAAPEHELAFSQASQESTLEMALEKMMDETP